ncbi:basic membrane lipoprotein [Leucobacter sp. 7(1)]|uniref:BMP family ABC transporter substrate-binding protein n=1 Tax=Leucobacter sp. 7(1) TaxID=1255613 RepID=UPI00097EC2B6|nr:BMP family ABC transporter substrate-binding protein [Leucobacter sp. 7(1)]SJN10643.1 basic membrane lipoprotein [Leucobacter sp. 7(1)]
MHVPRFRAALLAAGLAAALLLTSCAPGTQSEQGSTVAGPTFVYLTSDPIGQNGFFTSGKAGIEAVARTFDGRARTLEASDEATRRANLEAAVAEAPEVIVMLGASFAAPAKAVAEQNPQQRFLLIDTTVEGAPENLYQATFREHEAAYLLGVEAGRLTTTQRVSAVLAEDTPLLRKYSLAFAAGAQSVSPEVQVLPSPVIGADAAPYANPERGAQLATELAREGADQVFAVAARSNEGIMDAAKAQGFAAYGVDENQCRLAPGAVVDGTMKSVETVIATVVGQIMAGKSSSETTISFGLAEEGMTLVSLTPEAPKSECTIMEHPDVLSEVTELRDEIVAGTLKIPNPGA